MKRDWTTHTDRQLTKVLNYCTLALIVAMVFVVAIAIAIARSPSPSWWCLAIFAPGLFLIPVMRFGNPISKELERRGYGQ